jgi:hypothetical protein
MTAGARRASIRLLSACNNGCLFCPQAGTAESVLDPAALDAALTRAREEGDEVTFVGGEPTLWPRLPDAVRVARGLGFRRVGLQSNGRRLADRHYTATLVDAGLTDLQLSIHGASAAVHDYHTGIEGSLAQSVAGLAAARAGGLSVAVNTVLTRSNYRVLAEIPRLLATRGVSAWLVVVPHAAGRAAATFERTMARLALALPFALHALEGARALSLPAWIDSAPLCLLGPWAARALPSAPRAYGPSCAECAAQPACSGVDPLYLARFGGDELTARAAPDPLPPLPPEARWFVGAGVLAPSATPPAPRRTLPLLAR